MTYDRLTAYRNILKVRESAYRRNLFIAGGFFLFAIFSTLGMGLLTGGDGRSIYLLAGFDVLFIVNFVMAWARLEIVKGNIELIDNLQNRDRQISQDVSVASN